jgi:hypothetical protein
LALSHAVTFWLLLFGAHGGRASRVRPPLRGPGSGRSSGSG